MDETIAVLGTGLMGSAIAARLCETGRRVIVWNRTPAKSAPLAEAGAIVADSAAAALDAADVVFLVTIKTSDVTPFFDAAKGRLAGKTIVNLITGTPREIRALGDSVARTAADYLSGTIQCYPSSIGSAGATIYLGGSEDTWARQASLLRELAGASEYLGSDVALPNIIDAGATAAFFFSAMGACLEATGYAAREGLHVAAFRPYIHRALASLPAWLDALLDAVEAGDFGTEDATLHTFAGALDMARAAFADVGASDLVMAANRQRMRQAIAADDGGQGFAVLGKY